jgi:hypothetical protein
MQVSAHTDAVSLFDRYAKGDDNPDLKGALVEAAVQIRRSFQCWQSGRATPSDLAPQLFADRRS